MLNIKKKTCSVPEKYFPKKKNKQVKVKAGTKSKIEVKPTVKQTNLLANLAHKNSSGANNWDTFIKLKCEKTGIKMDCSDEYTTLETILPTQSNSGTKSSSRVKPTTKVNETNINSKAKKKAKCVKPKDKLPDKRGLSPPKRGSNQPQSSIKDKRPILDRNLDENGITSKIAIDCEMVGVEVGVKKDMLARVSIVNFHGNCIYDTFVKPVEPVVDYRTFVSGVRAKDLENAPDFATVQKRVADILKGRILVGHGLKKDLAVLFLNHPRYLIRDTSKYEKFRQGKPPALKKLAKEYLGVTIQNGEHSSIQDALAAMQLYKMFKNEWEDSLKRKKIKRHIKEKQVINLPATVTQAMSLMDV